MGEAGGSLGLWDFMRLCAVWPSVLCSHCLQSRSFSPMERLSYLAPSLSLPSPLIPPHPASSSFFQRLSYHAYQAKQTCLQVTLGASDGFTFSPTTLIDPIIGCKGVGSSPSLSVADGVPCRRWWCLIMVVHLLCWGTTFSGKTTVLTASGSTLSAGGTAGAASPQQVCPEVEV